LIPHRSYESAMFKQSDSFWDPGDDFPVVSGDRGRTFVNYNELVNSTPASEQEKELWNEEFFLEKERQALVNSLPTEEQEHYNHFAPRLTSSQQIYFLRLTDLAERDQYLRDIGVRDEMSLRGALPQGRTIASQTSPIRTVNSEGLRRGISKGDVLRLWGDPELVEVAGDPSNENERWTYEQNFRKYQIYFEEGKVDAWQRL